MHSSRASLVSLALLHLIAASVCAQSSGTKSSWKTLSGNQPLVISRGGFSGLFPDSSVNAYGLAMETSLLNVVLWCDVQLTKDGVGICLPDVKLDNSTDISNLFPKRDKENDVNGVSTNGWFSVDFTSSDLVNVSVKQGIYSRSNRFDENFFPILTPEDVVSQVKAQNLWLNIQHDAFFTQHKLSMRDYVISLSRTPGIFINVISSPEVAFLNGIKSRFNPKKTKLVFRFLQKDHIEPSTNQTYDFLSKNLTFIKTFASGILVPKDYIWPVDLSSYLQPHTSLVSDAHKQGLEIFGANFVNDYPLSYNYSFDPIAEYLNFVDNGEFSVDGVLSDFPITASATIDCFTQLGQNASKQAKPLVISKFGSSGDYPGCTDLAYTKAIQDGVEVIDCPVQLSSDGIPFCMSSINLIDSTDAAQSEFNDRIMTVPEIKTGTAIYAFNLTWEEIQSLKPVLASPYSPRYAIFRNTKNLNAGKFITLSEFLNMTKDTSSLSGILIGIENAGYLAQNQGLSVVDAVNMALDRAGFDNQTAHKVMIQSSNKNVLEKLKGKDYEIVYKIDEEIRDIDEPTLKDIASFAKSVVISKASIFPESQLYLTGETKVVSKLQSHKLRVYVETFSNEYVSQPWDFFSDATVEINTYVNMANIDGVVTDFPKTSARYKRNRCLERSGDEVPSYMSPVKPGGLLEIISPVLLPPAQAPNPILTEADVAEGPLPSASARNPPSTNGRKNNAQPKTTALFRFSSIAALISAAIFVF